MNNALRRAGLAMIVLTVLLLANLSYVQVVEAGKLRANPHNQLTRLADYNRNRGEIVDSSGNVILAKDVPDNGQPRYQRRYPAGDAYSTVTGYDSLLYGTRGIERSENSVLDGTDDSLFVQRMSDLITGRDANGGQVQLTIDPRVQKALYNSMTSRHYVGGAVAIQPSTGAILGMVSTPSYDPNPLASHSSTTQQKAWQKLLADKNKPLLNRAIGELEPPGSTFKLIDSSVALTNGYTEQSKLTAARQITLPGTNTTFTNDADQTCPDSRGGKVTMKTALAYSCNTAFATLTGALGTQKLRDMAGRYGVGEQKLRVPLPVAASTLGPIPDKAALYQSAIGQRDVKFTPLQDAMITATIANGGVRMQPQLLKRILGPDLSVVKNVAPSKAADVIPASVAKKITDMMLASEKYTVGGGKRPGLAIASKTGTAEVGVHPKSTPPVCWYTAFAPAANPQIAVAVMVDDGGGKGPGAFGSTVSAVVGRAAINAYLPQGGH
ncbi:MAG: peptidoglycan D,D-transpeptidase FtsI family protein [Sciscionella sp.]